MTRHFISVFILLATIGQGQTEKAAQLCSAVEARVCQQARAPDAGLANFTGRWVLSRQEGFDEFAASQGVPWVLRRLAALDRPLSEVLLDSDGQTMKHSLTEAARTQTATWPIAPASKARRAASSGGSCATNELRTIQSSLANGGSGERPPSSGLPERFERRLLNPLREEVDVTVEWSPGCEGVLVETHANRANAGHSVTMYRYLLDGGKTMAVTMESAGGVTADRYFAKLGESTRKKSAA